jgi:hypothetical protein
MMSNQLATTNSRELASLVQGVDTPLRTDLVVPYISLQQATSELVKARKAQMGDIVRSTTGEKIADPDTGFNVIFLHNPKADWVIEQKVGERYQYRKAMPRTAINESLAWNYFGDENGNEVPQGTRGATEWKRVKRLTVFCLLPQDILAEATEIAKAQSGELPDPSKALSPIVMSFRSTSYNTGKDISTFFSKATSLGAQVWQYQVTMSAHLEKDGNDSWYVWKANTTKTPPVPKELLGKVKDWVQILGHTQLVVHEDGETQVAQTEREVVDTKDVC